MRRTGLSRGGKPLKRRVGLTARVGLSRSKPLDRGGSLAASNSITNPHGLRQATPRRNTGFDDLTGAVILARDDLRCLACGISIIGIRASKQHRCARGAGGRGRNHPWMNSAVNGATLCGDGTTGCHGLCEARDEGMHCRGFWLIEGLDFTNHPGEAPLLVATIHGLEQQWLTPDGQRVNVEPDWAEVTW